jgi:UDP-N-acetylmuramyl tripeptide synthase
MSALWTSDEIAAAVGGVASGAFSATSVTFDSREVEAGSLFIALKGEMTDGHRFVAKALDSGAAGVIVSDPCARVGHHGCAQRAGRCLTGAEFCKADRRDGLGREDRHKRGVG